MRKNTCDICGKETTDKYIMEELYKKYQIDGIVDYCPECRKEISAIILKIDNAIKGVAENWVRKMIKKLKGEKNDRI